MRKSIAIVTMLAMLVASPLAVSEYVVTINTNSGAGGGGGDGSYTQEQKESAWETFFNDIGEPVPGSWAEGFSFRNNSLTFTSFPDEPYPSSTVADLETSFNEDLKDIGGLSSIDTITGDLTIEDASVESLTFTELKSVDGSLRLTDLTSMTEAPSFPSLSTSGSIQISNVAAVPSDFSMFPSLNSAGGLSAEDTGNTSFSGLSGVSIGSVSDPASVILTNTAATTLSGLEGISHIERVKLEYNSNLSDISALSGIKTINPYEWQDNYSITFGVNSSLSPVSLDFISGAETLEGKVDISNFYGGLEDVSAISNLSFDPSSDAYINPGNHEGEGNPSTKSPSDSVFCQNVEASSQFSLKDQAFFCENTAFFALNPNYSLRFNTDNTKLLFDINDQNYSDTESFIEWMSSAYDSDNISDNEQNTNVTSPSTYNTGVVTSGGSKKIYIELPPDQAVFDETVTVEVQGTDGDSTYTKTASYDVYKEYIHGTEDGDRTDQPLGTVSPGESFSIAFSDLMDSPIPAGSTITGIDGPGGGFGYYGPTFETTFSADSNNVIEGTIAEADADKSGDFTIDLTTPSGKTYSLDSKLTVEP